MNIVSLQRPMQLCKCIGLLLYVGLIADLARAFTSIPRATLGISLACGSSSIPNFSPSPILQHTLQVSLEDRSYPIYIGSGLLGGGSLKGAELRRHLKSKKALVITNTKVAPLYLAAVRQSLEGSGTEVFEVILPDGEEFKTMDVLMKIIDKAMEAKLDRKSSFIALGGGVVGDMTGFAAAIYQRGVKFIQIPTTLMAMVDSAVGGKTAVNHPLGKNMIGAFYQPECVIVDTDTLSTLPDRELRSGIAEVVKYGLIRDPGFFEWLEKNMPALLKRDPAHLAETIRRSCQNKADVVAADEKEDHLRATLNLGHTFGHAIETGLGYGSWLHGEAVSTGMVMAAELSARHGWVRPDIVTRTRKLLQSAGVPTTLMNEYAPKIEKKLTVDAFIDLMSMDKKVANGQLSLVLLQGELGSCVITNEFKPDLLRQVVQEFCAL